MSPYRVALPLLLLILTIASQATAQFTRHSMVLSKGSVEITGMPARPTMLALDISKDSDLSPFHAPLHLYFGVTNDFTVGITHEIGPFYRWGGPCFNCGRGYDDVGVGFLYNLVKSQSFELDLHFDAPVFLRFDPPFLAVRGGVLGRGNIGSVVAIVFDPSLQIGLTRRANRQDDGRRGGNKDYLWLPAWFYFQVTPSVAPFVGTGLGGSLEGFFDHVEVPLELGCIFSITPNIDVGGMIQFNNLLGDGGSFDQRQIGFLGRFRFGG